MYIYIYIVVIDFEEIEKRDDGSLFFYFEEIKEQDDDFSVETRTKHLK